MRDKVKKTVKFTALALCLGLISVLATTSCDKLQRLRVDELIEVISNLPCDCIMDTLKGEWVWFKTFGSIGAGTADNRYKSVIKILGQNADSSINYEIWVRDTLFGDPLFPTMYYHNGIFFDDTLWYQGSFQIQHDQWSDRYALIELPHVELFLGRGWNVYLMEDPWPNPWKPSAVKKPSKDTLIFGNRGVTDGYYYYYKRIK